MRRLSLVCLPPSPFLLSLCHVLRLPLLLSSLSFSFCVTLNALKALNKRVRTRSRSSLRPTYMRVLCTFSVIVGGSPVVLPAWWWLRLPIKAKYARMRSAAQVHVQQSRREREREQDTVADKASQTVAMCGRWIGGQAAAGREQEQSQNNF